MSLDRILDAERGDWLEAQELQVAAAKVEAARPRRVPAIRKPRPSTARVRRRWSPDEDVTLRRLAARDLSIAEAAAEMGRIRQVVRMHAIALELTMRDGRRRA